MIVNEKRKATRINPIESEPAFLQIKHTFGNSDKSVYKVDEFDEFGLSFFVPVNDGYFLPGTPLEYRLFNGKVSGEESYGIVRYHYRQNNGTGESFYKIGMEIDQSFGNTIRTRHSIRPKRYSGKNENIHPIIRFPFEQSEWEFTLIDISGYSAAFYCTPEQAISLRISNILSPVTIKSGYSEIYHGPVIITRSSREKNRYRVVIEPRNRIFDVDLIEGEETLEQVKQYSQHLIERHERYAKIDPKFKAIVADMHGFLSEYKNFLESPMVALLGRERPWPEILENVKAGFCERMDSYFKELEKIGHTPERTEDDQRTYTAYFQGHILPFLLSSSLWHRIYFKPLGYPGDYEIMRLIKENAYEGPTLFSQLLNKFALEATLAQANRNRIKFLSNRIAEIVENSGLQRVEILSIACGPALEIERLLQDHKDLGDRISLTLLDQDISTLRCAQENLYRNRILYDSKMELSFLHKSIGGFLREITKKKNKIGKYHLIYIFGLFDYFDDKTCKFCLKHTSKLLHEEGTILLSNYSLDNHHDRTFVEFGGEWYMIYRDKQQMFQLCKGLGNVKDVTVKEDETGVIKFLELHFQ